MPSPLFCTKIASRLARTYTDKHGLKDVTRDLLGIDLSKQQQLSDWGSSTLSEAQVAYAASDVLHLHALRDKLDTLLTRENRGELAKACFGFLPTRAKLDLAGWVRRTFFRIREGPRAYPGHIQGLSGKGFSTLAALDCGIRLRLSYCPNRPFGHQGL